MARVTHVHALDEVARRISENRELIDIVSANSDNIDYGEMIWVDNGTEEGIKTFTDRGIKCLQDFIADIRTWRAGSASSCVTSNASPTSSNAPWPTRAGAEARRSSA